MLKKITVSLCAFGAAAFLAGCSLLNPPSTEPATMAAQATNACGTVEFNDRQAKSSTGPNGGLILARISSADTRCEAEGDMIKHTVRVALQAGQNPGRNRAREPLVVIPYQLEVRTPAGKVLAKRRINRELRFDRNNGVQVTDFLVHRMPADDTKLVFAVSFP